MPKFNAASQELIRATLGVPFKIRECAEAEVECAFAVGELDKGCLNGRWDKVEDFEKITLNCQGRDYDFQLTCNGDPFRRELNPTRCIYDVQIFPKDKSLEPLLDITDSIIAEARFRYVMNEKFGIDLSAVDEPML